MSVSGKTWSRLLNYSVQRFGGPLSQLEVEMAAKRQRLRHFFKRKDVWDYEVTQN